MEQKLLYMIREMVFNGHLHKGNTDFGLLIFADNRFLGFGAKYGRFIEDKNWKHAQRISYVKSDLHTLTVALWATFYF